MIRKVCSIKDFGCFKDFHWDGDLQPFSKTNLIYGYNGSGKTTLCNLLYLLSPDCKDKAELINEYIVDSTDFEIETEKGNFSRKNFEGYSAILYVFNSKFIKDHIFDGSKSKISPFSSEIGLTNDTINELDNNIKRIILRKNKLTSFHDQLENKLNSIWEIRKKEFNTKIEGKRLTSSVTITDNNSADFEEENSVLAKLYDEYEIVKNIDILQENISFIEEKLKEVSILDIDLNSLNRLLELSINRKSTEKIKTHIEKLSHSIGQEIDINHWLVEGMHVLKKNKESNNFFCPLCHSNIKTIVEKLIKEYSEYFTKELNDLFSELNDFENQIMKIPEKISQYEKVIGEIAILLKRFNYSLGNHIEYNKGESDIQLKKLIDLISQKKKNPGLINTIDEIPYKEFERINLQIEAVVYELNEFIKKQKTKITTLLNKDIVKKIKEQVALLSIAEYNMQSNCVIQMSKKRNSDIAKKINTLTKDIEKQLKELYYRREIEVSKLDAETKFVNIYLEYLGISKFSIQKKENRDTDNLIISYKSGIKKHSLSCSLSEGEKTALAFSYFLSKIRVECIETKICTFDQAIIVIDDPISSLDENRLYHTANLIDSFLHYNDYANNQRPSQTFLFSHNITFLKYITNIFYANSVINKEIKEYYIEPFKHKITNIPNPLKNFTTTYLEKLDEIIRYQSKSSEIGYDDAKKFIPNYIRIVLESFLSFKFALVKEGDNQRLPGLNFLIGRAISELANYDEKIKIGAINKEGVIKRLHFLKRIADNESHGSISKIESLNYISEEELQDYCKFTLQIIRFFDEIHFQKAKALI